MEDPTVPDKPDYARNRGDEVRTANISLTTEDIITACAAVKGVLSDYEHVQRRYELNPEETARVARLRATYQKMEAFLTEIDADTQAP